jgi:hypothetical protein
MHRILKTSRLDLYFAPFLTFTLLLPFNMFGQTWQAANQYALGNSPISRILVADILGTRSPAALVVNGTGLMMVPGDGKGNLVLPAATLRSNVLDAAVGDFLNKRREDLVVIGPDDNGTNVGVYLVPNLGKGKLGTPAPVPVPGISAFDATCRVVSGVFTTSGHVDIVVMCPSAAQPLQLGVNDGSGSFTFTAITGPSGRTIQDIAAGDFDRDGFSDLVITSVGSVNDVSRDVFWNNGGNGFTAQSSAFPSDSTFLVAADYNGDGRADVIVLRNGTLTPYQSQGSPRTFTVEPPAPDTTCSIQAFGVGSLQKIDLGVTAGDIISGEQCGTGYQLRVIHNLNAVELAIKAEPNFTTARYLASLTIQAAPVYRSGIPTGTIIAGVNSKKHETAQLINGSVTIPAQLKAGMNHVPVVVLPTGDWAGAATILHIYNHNHDTDNRFPPPLPTSMHSGKRKHLDCVLTACL